VELQVVPLVLAEVELEVQMVQQISAAEVEQRVHKLEQEVLE
jgi:hypothetical protein